VQRAQIGLAHQASDAVLAPRLSGFAEIEEDARRAVNPVTGHERHANQAEQTGILLCPVRDRLEHS
jgi:hypothetical protein